jgi:hypothetical protein
VLEDVIARLAARKVKIDPDLPLLLIRHSRAQWLDPGADLYEKTRKWWRVGKRKENAKFALAVYDGIAPAVFRSIAGRLRGLRTWMGIAIGSADGHSSERSMSR